MVIDQGIAGHAEHCSARHPQQGPSGPVSASGGRILPLSTLQPHAAEHHFANRWYMLKLLSLFIIDENLILVWYGTAKTGTKRCYIKVS